MTRVAVVAALTMLTAGAVAAADGFVQIVVPSKASSVENYGAKELQGFLRQISGDRLQVASERSRTGSPAFLIGKTELARNNGLLDSASKLQEDGVLIKTVGRDVALVGQNDRGTLYSVYVLLEKYYGVRYLAHDCTIIPKRADLTLPKLDYSYAPPFMYRETLYWDSFPKPMAPRQRLNGPYTKCDAETGGKIEFYPYVHSFDDLIPEKEFFKDHPEYFGLQGGKRVAGEVHAQICLTNPDVLEIAKRRVLQWIDEHPEVPIIDVSQNDGNGWCECDRCMAVANEEGSQHGPILRFVNAIADVVAEKHPDKWVETLAYVYSTKPPAITKPRPNVIIRLCHAGCYFHGFEKCGLGANLSSYIDEWSKLTKRIFIWHYSTNFAHYLAPNPDLAGLARDIKYYAAHGVNGLMVQCDYQGPGGELAEMRQYLAARLMWDPSLEASGVIREFCRGYYEDAADEALEFVKLMDETAANPDIHAFGAWDPRATVSSELVTKSLSILGRAYSAARSAKVRNRVEKLMLPFWYMQLSFPDAYPVSDTTHSQLAKRVKQVLERNKITHVREGGENASGWIGEIEARYTELPKDVVADLTRIDRAKVTNCADFRVANVDVEGRRALSVFQHPPASGDGDALYVIELPDKPAKLAFGTVITGPTVDGVRFSVLVDGREVWNETKRTHTSAGSADAQSAILPGANPFAKHEVDLSAYAGKKIALTLRVNAIADSSSDWANWVEPRVMLVTPR